MSKTKNMNIKKELEKLGKVYNEIGLLGRFLIAICLVAIVTGAILIIINPDLWQKAIAVMITGLIGLDLMLYDYDTDK